MAEKIRNISLNELAIFSDELKKQYAKKTYVDAAVKAAVAHLGTASFEKADTVPAAEDAKENILYLVYNDETAHYDIYALVGGAVELLDDTTVDLTGYVEKDGEKQLSDENYTVADKEKLAAVSEGATKTEACETNGSLRIDGKETVVYTLPDDVLHESDIEAVSEAEIRALFADGEAAGGA